LMVSFLSFEKDFIHLGLSFDSNQHKKYLIFYNIRNIYYEKQMKSSNDLKLKLWTRTG
jgi:hypothetical protein